MSVAHVLVAGASSAEATGRPIRFSTIGPEQGLSNASVLFAFQDEIGFIWLGTEGGLNRYDGQRLTVFRTDPGDPNSIPDEFVWAMRQDPSGDLWLATEAGGIARRDHATGRFTRYRHDRERDTSIGSNRTRALLFAAGSVWIGTRDSGVDRMDPVTGVVEHFRHDPDDATSLSHDSIYALHEDHEGFLWIGTNDGLNRLDPKTGRFERWDQSSERALGDEQVRSIEVDRSGAVWVGTRSGGLTRIAADLAGVRHYRNDPRRPDSLSNDLVRAILQDRAGRLWVGTANGLDLLADDGGGFAHYRNAPGEPASLPDSSIMSLFEDTGGILWVGTQFGGVAKWNPATWSFGHQTTASSGLSGENVAAFARGDDGTLWIGTIGSGLNRVDGASGAITRYRRGEGIAGLTDDRVMLLHLQSNGTLWAGTLAGGLHRLAPGSRRFRIYRHDPARADSISADGIMSLHEDADGSLWIGTFGGGLNQYDPATDSFSAYRSGGPDSLTNDVVTAISHDAGEGLWLGTDGGGLNRLDKRTGAISAIRHDPESPSSLSSDTVYSLYRDARGTLWVGTRGGGLDRLLRPDGPGGAEFRNYSQRDGMASSVVYSILPDDEGRLWLSTNAGISRLDPESGEVRNFNVSHGLQGNDFNFGAHYRASNGELYFGGANGYNVFDPDRLESNQHVPPVVLTAFRMRNRSVDLDVPVHLLQSAELGYRDDVVSFEFAALDYAAPAQNRYQYRLAGFDTDWVDAGDIPRANYTNLSPASYVFRVRASNNDGVWNEEGLRLALVVSPPPWKTGWAYAGYALVLLAGGALLARGQRRRSQGRERYRRHLEREVEARTQELRERNLQLEELNVRLSEASLTDSLTGLRNRRFLFEEIARDAALIQREHSRGREQSQLAFIMVDLDNFKPINDSLGHAAGDQVLLQVRDILERACRSSDVLIRWGGDEFLVVGRDADLASSEKLPERIRAAVEEHPFQLGGGSTARITCSIGVAYYPFIAHHPEAANLDHVVGLADKALYVAKRSGRNAWVAFLATQRMDVESLARLSSEEAAKVVAEGMVELRSSLPADRDLVLV